MKNWYVVNTHSHSEHKAALHLQRQGFKVYLPVYLKKRSHARKVDWIHTPIFSRYLFVWVDILKDRWTTIRSTVGVGGILCQGGVPVSVPEEIIEQIKGRENTAGVVELGEGRGLKRGDKIKVLYGPMADYLGLFDFIDEQMRAFVLLELMGRKVKVRLDQESIVAFG